MHVYVDLLSKGSFFISVELSDDQLLSFDYSVKGHNVLRQARAGMYGNVDDPGRRNYKIVEAENGRLKRIRRSFWVARGSVDVVNGVGWKTVSKGKLDNRIKNRLLAFSNEIHDNWSNELKLNSLLKRLDEYLFSVVTASPR